MSDDGACCRRFRWQCRLHGRRHLARWCRAGGWSPRRRLSGGGCWGWDPAYLTPAHSDDTRDIINSVSSAITIYVFIFLCLYCVHVNAHCKPARLCKCALMLTLHNCTGTTVQLFFLITETRQGLPVLLQTDVHFGTGVVKALRFEYANTLSTRMKSSISSAAG
jgi:hypothetical protein